MIDVHPGEPEGFNIVVERFGEVGGDVLVVGAEDVVELRDSTGGENRRDPGTGGHTEAREEEIELAGNVGL